MEDGAEQITREYLKLNKDEISSIFARDINSFGQVSDSDNIERMLKLTLQSALKWRGTIIIDKTLSKVCLSSMALMNIRQTHPELRVMSFYLTSQKVSDDIFRTAIVALKLIIFNG
jgi:hypothetical protein